MSPRGRVNRPHESAAAATYALSNALSAVSLDLDDLLEGGPVLPRDQRLGDRAERAEVDRVEAGLVAGLPRLGADVVRPVQFGRVDLQGGPERTTQCGAAADERTASAVDARVTAAHRLLQEGAQVLDDVAVPAMLPCRAEVLAVV